MSSSVHVLVIGPPPGGPGGVSSVAETLQHEYAAARPDWLSIEFVPTLKDGRPTLTVFALAGLRLVWRTLRSRPSKQVVWHLQVASRGSTYRKYVLSVLARTLRVEYVCHLHGGMHHKFYDSSGSFIRRITRSLFQHAATTVVLGEGWRRYAADTLGVAQSAVVVVANGTSAPPDPPGRSGDRSRVRPRVVFVGRIEELKGIHELLAACDQLASRVEFTLALVGEADDAALFSDIQRRSYVEAHGGLPRPDVLELMRDSDVFVLPSHIEGMPMALLEAMSLGLPVITTPVGSIPHYLVDQREGFLVPPRDVDALARALETLLQDPHLRSRMGDAAYSRWHQELRADAMFDRLAKVWQATIPRASRGTTQ